MADKKFGAIPSPLDVRDYRIKAISDLPETFELHIFKRTKNQGSVNSCVAHALSTVVEYFNYLQYGTADLMSTNWIYGNRRNTGSLDKGMVIRFALSNLIDWGDVREVDCKGNYEVPKCVDAFEAVANTYRKNAEKYAIASYFKLHNEQEIKTALKQYGPVVIGMRWYTDMKTDSNGILTSARKDKDGFHCMVIYGWDEHGWKALNSWGGFWGDAGRCIIPYDFKLSEAWGIEDSNGLEGLERTPIKHPWSTKVGEFFARILNKFLNLFRKLK